MNKNLYVTTCIFNPMGFKSRYRLYENFKKHMAESGAKLFTVEIAFGDQPFRVTTADDPMNLQLRSNQIIWHKESALNLGIRHLLHYVPDAQYLGWFDSDTTFANEDWVAETVHKLTYLAVLQPYSEAINLNSKDEYMWNCPSSFKSFIEGRGYHQEPELPLSYTYKGHPGLAWCARRDVFEAIGGLYEFCVNGSADTVMSNALKGDWTVYLPSKPTEGLRKSMEEWSLRAQKVVQGRIGYVRGAVLHHWHGRSEDRGYEKRWSILSFHKFDPTTDIEKDPSTGLLRWTGTKPKLEDDIRFSLAARNEDEL